MVNTWLSVLLLFSPVLAENEDGIEPTPTPDTTTADMIIDYLEKEKKAKEEAEANERNEALLLSIQEGETNAIYANSQNVINGYCNKYRYYIYHQVPYNDGYYTRYNYYCFVFDRFTKFSLDENILTFDGNCLHVSAPYSGNVSTEKRTEPINLGGLSNVYSNIDIVSAPSLPSINKDASEIGETLLNVFVMLFTFIIGLRITYKLFDGKSQQ